MKRHYLPLSGTLGAPPKFTGIFLYPMHFYLGSKLAQAACFLGIQGAVSLNDIGLGHLVVAAPTVERQVLTTIHVTSTSQAGVMRSGACSVTPLFQ